MQEFKLPDLGEGMHEAEIRRWLIQAGDTIKLDQPMVEVETDKAVVEIPAPVAGKVANILVPAGKVAQLGETLITFETASTAPVVQASASNIVSAAFPIKAAGGTATRSRVLAAPAVRKRAFELGIDLEQVPASHPSGRVTMEDIESYARQTSSPALASALSQTTHVNGIAQNLQKAQVPSLPAAVEATALEERQPLTGLRKRIAERMERSWRTIPHAVAFEEADGSELVALRQALKPVAEQRGVRLTYMPLLVKLLVPVLKEFPIFNASLDEEKREIIYKHVYHIGIAADAPEGLLVPVLRNADKLTVLDIAKQLEHLVEGAHKRTLTVSEVAGSTFTLNNIGSFGGSSGVPIINYPEAAILAIGRLQEKAVVRSGALVARTMMPLTLSFDHRLIDGAQAGKFLARFKELVEHPQRLLLDMI